MRYKKSEIKEMSNEDLIIAYNLIVVQSVKEENMRGRTKSTHDTEEFITNEMCSRFNMDYEYIRSRLEQV